MYKDDCTDRGEKCKTCKKNPKHSYYEPVEIPFSTYVYPYIHYPYIYYPYQYTPTT